MALEGTVKLPGVGEVSKRNAAIGAAIVLGILGIAYYRHAKNTASTNASPGGGTAAGAAGTTGQVTDPAGNVCSAVDASGYCPGTDQSNAYLAEQNGYYGSSGYDQYGGYAGGGGTGGYGGGECSLPDGTIGVYDSLGNCVPITGGGGGTTNPTTAAQWVAATAPLVPGSPAAFEAAAAKVFAGLTVTTNQKDLFLEGVGLNPLPPNVTYPQPIKTSDTPGQPGPGGGRVKVPQVTGLRAEDAAGDIGAAGLNPRVTPGTPPGKVGHITSQVPKANSMVAAGSTVTLHNKVT